MSDEKRGYFLGLVSLLCLTVFLEFVAASLSPDRTVFRFIRGLIREYDTILFLILASPIFGLLIGLLGRQFRHRLSIAGIILNGLTILAVGGFFLYRYLK